MSSQAARLFALALAASVFTGVLSQNAIETQTRMILTGYYDSECLNPLPQTSHPNPQTCAVGQCCTRSDGTTSLKLVSCGSHVNAIVYSDENCETPIVRKSQLDGGIKLELKTCNPTSGIFFAPGSFYKADCVVPVDNQVAWDVIMAIVFCIVFAFIGFMSIREFMDMRRGIVPKIVFD